MFNFILQMSKHINLLKVGVIAMETHQLINCLTAHIVVLDTNKWIDMAPWLLVSYIPKGTSKGVINEHLKKDGHLDWFANITLKAIFSF